MGVQGSSSRTGLDRRRFLAIGAGSAAAAGIGARPARAQLNAARRTAQNVIFLVSDGMSFGTLQLANLYIRERDGADSEWVRALNEPGVRRALMDTSSADSIVTDSAASATAWAIGERVNNRMVGLTPDGRTPTPIWIHARQQGKATGLVTTTRLTHATPACFFANVLTNRDDEAAIAQQLLDRPIDLMLGGGGKFLEPALAGRDDPFFVVRTKAELDAVPAGDPKIRRLLGVFNADHMSYELDRPESEPSIADMTRAALARLSRSAGGFVVQIEGGRVDHAAHANDAGSLVRDQVAFDEAVGVALDFARGRDDTLVILTTDHGTANPGLTDYGPAGRRGFERLFGFRRSFQWMLRRIVREARSESGLDTELVRAIVAEGTGIALPDEDMDVLARWLSGELVDPFLLANKDAGPLGSVLANHLAIAFLSPNHTSDYVEVTAFGPGSERLTQHIGIERLHSIMVEAMDLAPAGPI